MFKDRGTDISFTTDARAESYEKSHPSEDQAQQPHLCPPQLLNGDSVMVAVIEPETAADSAEYNGPASRATACLATTVPPDGPLAAPRTSRSPTPSRFGARLQDVKRLFTNLTRPIHRSRARSPAANQTPGLSSPKGNASEPTTIPLSPECNEYSEPPSITTSISSESDFVTTPPTSPEYSNGQSFYSLQRAHYDNDHYSCSASLSDSNERSNGLYIDRNSLLQVKEGKKPDRSGQLEPRTRAGRIFDFSNRVDIDGLSATFDSLLLHKEDAKGDTEDWFGLEYTLQLSSRERTSMSNPSSSCSAGEHSKSRESWAALHRGSIITSRTGSLPPFLASAYENESYHQWRNWHHHLDQLEQMRKRQRVLEFEEESEELAWLYVEGVKLYEVLCRQLEYDGVISPCVEDRLQFIEERRPDPYYPPRKHDFIWFSQRSRSLASLRELRSKPIP
ncbi:hypothetical protein AX16_000926 [Volvariella volvacea WC 439]|nr:hypothetical protein AX16_000926 [Volvariella volvacea WC 439]